MKTPPPLALLAATVLLPACSTPSGMTIQQYASLAGRPERPATALAIQMTVAAPGSAAVEFPARKISVGKPVRFSAGKEFVYPASYQPAIPAADRGTVVPATPADFKSVNTGIEADLRCRREGAVEIVEGTISVTDFQGFSKMGGAYGEAILDENGRLITENRVEMPKFATYTTPVWVAVKPGDSATFAIAHPRKNATATVRVSPVE